jgi:hypothetical protein
VVAFNAAEGWSRDVTEEIARAPLEREAREGDLSESAKIFVERVLDIATRVIGSVEGMAQDQKSESAGGHSGGGRDVLTRRQRNTTFFF